MINPYTSQCITNVANKRSTGHLLLLKSWIQNPNNYYKTKRFSFFQLSPQRLSEINATMVHKTIILHLLVVFSSLFYCLGLKVFPVVTSVYEWSLIKTEQKVSYKNEEIGEIQWSGGWHSLIQQIIQNEV